MTNAHDGLYEIIIIGEGGVGKSSLTHRFMGYEFVESYDPTVEGIYRSETEVDGAMVEVEITDTAGQDSFRDILTTYYGRSGAGYMLVFSLVARDTFLTLKSKIYQDLVDTKRSLSSHAQERIPMVLIGNKSDMAPKREVETIEGHAQAREWECNFFETSAKLDENVLDPFIRLIREMNSSRIPITPSKKKMCPCTLL